MSEFLAILSVAACAYAASISLEAREATSCSRQYTVAAGDFCDKISASQNVSTYQLAFNNPQINTACTNIFVGQVLCLGKTGQDCTDVQVVEAGSGCFDMYTAAGISADTFYHNNPNVASDCSNIYPEEVLCIAGETFNYTS